MVAKVEPGKLYTLLPGTLVILGSTPSHTYAQLWKRLRCEECPILVVSVTPVEPSKENPKDTEGWFKLTFVRNDGTPRTGFIVQTSDLHYGTHNLVET